MHPHGSTYSTLLFLALVAPAWSAVSSDSWTQYRGTNRDGISTEKLIFGNQPPEVLWKASIGIGYTSMAIASEMVYASGNKDNQDTLFCLDVKTGKSIWTFSYPQELTPNLYQGGPNATPTVADGSVYILAKDGFAACLDAKTGKVAWKKNVAKEAGAKKPSWGFSGSPTIMGRIVYLNVGSHGLALEAATGNIIWKSGGDAAGYATIIPRTVGENVQLLVFGGDALHGVDAASGKELWSHPWKTDHGVNAADPIVFNNQVFLSSGYNFGSGLIDISGTPKEIWKNKEMRNHFNTCVLLDGHLYGFDEKSLKCLDWATGNVAWKEDSLGKGSLAVCNGALVIVSDKGELVIADAKSDGYKERSRTHVVPDKNVWTSPAIADGKIFVRNPKGDLVALVVK
jgi:outer membrane protein assembly factor BamB